jgi:hypothetical protein
MTLYFNILTICLIEKMEKIYFFNKLKTIFLLFFFFILTKNGLIGFLFFGTANKKIKIKYYYKLIIFKKK